MGNIFGELCQTPLFRMLLNYPSHVLQDLPLIHRLNLPLNLDFTQNDRLLSLQF